jgi:hypothetical protein
MFQMHRIFCATPWELEAELYRFYEVIGRFNETVAMQMGVLYVPVALTNVMDKRPQQYAVDQNIRDCRHYILLLSEDWGPVARNFKNDYQLALQCIDDPALPMQSVAVLAKKQPSGQPLAEGLPEPRATFSTLAEFDECVTALLSGWLESLSANDAPARAATAS